MNGIPQSAIDAGLSFPYLSFVTLPFFNDRRQLTKVSCMQMTETKLFFVWDAMYRPENIEFFRRMGMIDQHSPPPAAVPQHQEVPVNEHGHDDDFEEGLFTTADTVAAAAAAEVGGKSESQALGDVYAKEIPGAGPSALLSQVDLEEEEDEMVDEEGSEGEWQDPDSGSETDESFDVGAPGAHPTVGVNEREHSSLFDLAFIDRAV